MLIFNNTSNSEPFSVVLRDKLVNTSTFLSLKLTKLDDLTEEEFSLSNISTSSDYYTFVIDPSGLEQGEYRAEIRQGFGATADCVVNTPEFVLESTVFDCSPLILNDEFVVQDEALFTDQIPGSVEVYITKARVEGPQYNTIYRNEAEPTYHVYNE